MIHWAWLVPAVIGGFFIGYFLVAVFAADELTEEGEKHGHPRDGKDGR